MAIFLSSLKQHNSGLRLVCFLFCQFTIKLRIILAEFPGMGCTMRFFLEWAWKKVIHTKSCVDKLCM
jgi:hypothetical protein